LSVTESVINGITHVISTTGYPGVFLSMTLESACIPLPSVIIMPFAGKLIVDGAHFNIYALSLVGALGNLLGSIIAYWVGAIGGRPFVEKYGKYVMVTQSDLDSGDKWFTRYGDATAFFSRLLPIVRTFISLPAGISRMPFGKFCLYTFLGALPFCYGLTYAGVKLGENWKDVSVVLHKADLVIIAVFLILFALWLYKHFRGRPVAKVSSEAH
jgi:membrane protein DedA with SNARE-associated domain